MGSGGRGECGPPVFAGPLHGPMKDTELGCQPHFMGGELRSREKGARTGTPGWLPVSRPHRL